MHFLRVFVEGASLFPAQHNSFAGKWDEVALPLEIKVLSELNSTAADPDDLHPHLLKACSRALSLLLYLLFSSL